LALAGKYRGKGRETMKRIGLGIGLFIIFISYGCATSSYSVGQQFASENVSKIVKGKTTTDDLLNLFGQPFTKTVVSETEEKWLYMHSAGTASAQSYVVTMKVQTTGYQKMLDILIKNGIVTNFAYTEGPAPTTTVQ